MEEDLISVVLPIYGVEKYLDRCVQSVVQQTYKNLEILLVDDGSPDDCPAMCDCWAQADSRIKVFHKFNEGLGMARNTGLENAAGRYIFFIDSDDYVSPNMVEKCWREAKKTNADIVLYGSFGVDENGKIIKTIIPQPEKELYVGDEVIRDVLPDLILQDQPQQKNKDLSMNAWSCMYSMDLIGKYKWRFVSEREFISEDIYSLLYLYRHVDRVAVLSEGLYFYCYHAASLSHAYKADSFSRLTSFYHACQKAGLELGYSDVIRARLGELVFSLFIGAFKNIENADMTGHEKRARIAGAIRSKELQEIMQEIDVHQDTLKRRIFYYAIRARMVTVVHILLRFKAAESGAQK